MNEYFVVGVVKKNPVVSGEKKKEITLTLSVPGRSPGELEEMTLKILDGDLFKQVKKIKPFDLLFAEGHLTADGGLLTRNLYVVSSFNTVERAMKMLYGIDRISVGVVTGKVIGIEKEEYVLSVPRDKGVYYGDLKEEDILRIQKDDLHTKTGYFISLRVTKDKDRIISVKEENE